MPSDALNSTMQQVMRYDDFPTGDITEVNGPVNPMQEMGVSGLKRAAGIIDEEFLPALRGRKAIKVFREMSLNDPIVGALLFTIRQLIRGITYRVEGPDNTPESTEAADFLESCMDDMSHTWGDMIVEVLSMLEMGFSWHEIVYKKRMGPWEKDPTKKSKYNDGKIGWRKIPIRSQETMIRWIFDDTGGIQGMVQMSPPYYQTTVLPIEKSLLFRWNASKGNPEGQSILRNAYRPWFFKKRLEEFEAIGVERDLAGMPVAKVPASYMMAKPGSNEEKVYKSFKRMVQNVRRDEHEGLVLPLEYDRETKQPLFEFDLMSAAGSRQFDTNSIIERYEQRILMSVLADFIMVGHEGTGSYALHVDKTGIFRTALNSIADSICDVFNRHAIPRLFELNGWRMEELPKIVPNNVDPPDLTQLSQFMTSMGQLGMEFFPDADLEKFLRETAHLPDIPDEMLEMRRQMSMQHSVMSYAQSQMDFLGVKQKAEMTAQGMSPEQAQMQSEQPTPEMQQQMMDQQSQQAQMDAQNGMAGDQQKAELQGQQMQQQDQSAAGQHQRAIELAQLQESHKQNDHKRALELTSAQQKAKDQDGKRQVSTLSATDKFKDKDAKRSAFLERAKAQRVNAKPAAKKPAPKPAPKKR